MYFYTLTFDDSKYLKLIKISNTQINLPYWFRFGCKIYKSMIVLDLNVCDCLFLFSEKSLNTATRTKLSDNWQWIPTKGTLGHLNLYSTFSI